MNEYLIIYHDNRVTEGYICAAEAEEALNRFHSFFEGMGLEIYGVMLNGTDADLPDDNIVRRSSSLAAKDRLAKGSLLALGRGDRVRCWNGKIWFGTSDY